VEPLTPRTSPSIRASVRPSFCLSIRASVRPSVPHPVCPSVRTCTTFSRMWLRNFSSLFSCTSRSRCWLFSAARASNSFNWFCRQRPQRPQRFPRARRPGVPQFQGDLINETGGRPGRAGRQLGGVWQVSSRATCPGTNRAHSGVRCGRGGPCSGERPNAMLVCSIMYGARNIVLGRLSELRLHSARAEPHQLP
jgi:hypothetical protein